MIDNDIKQLLKRFMAGETTPEEERRIGRYMSTCEPENDDERAYKAMFAWFDDGMTTEVPVIEKPSKVKRNRPFRLLIGIASVAAAVLLLFIFMPEKEQTISDKPVAKVSIEPRKAEMRIDSVRNDSTSEPSQNVRKTRRRRTVRRFEVAPPKEMIASTMPDSVFANDIVIAEAKIKEIEQRQNQLEEMLDSIFSAREQDIDIITAALEGEDIYYITEDETY